MGLSGYTTHNAREVKPHWQCVRQGTKLVEMHVLMWRTRVRFAIINSKFSNFLLISENAHKVTSGILIYGWFKSLQKLKRQESPVFKFQ